MHEHASKSPLSPVDSQEDQEMEESESEEVDPHLLHDLNPDDVSGLSDSDASGDTLMLPGGGPGDVGVRDTSFDSDEEDGGRVQPF